MAKRLSKAESQARQNEILGSPIRMDGQGEDPIVRTLLSDQFINASDEEAMTIALALQKLVRGQDAMLNRMGEMSEEISRLKAEAAARDETTRKYNEDRMKFVQDVMDQAEKRKPRNATERERLAAKTAQITATAYQEGRIEGQAMLARSAAAFDQVLAARPKVTVTSPGYVEYVSQNGQSVPTLMNDVIKIKHRSWVLPAGQAIEVPDLVAKRFYEIQREREEREARAEAWRVKANGSVSEDVDINRRLEEINRKYGTTTAPMPIRG